MKYRHFKGGVYEVISDATHSETLERVVVYRDEDGETWVRPYEMFYGMVTHEGLKQPRFAPVGGEKTNLHSIKHKSENEAHSWLNMAFCDTVVLHRLWDPDGPDHGRTIRPKYEGRFFQSNELIITRIIDGVRSKQRYVFRGNFYDDGAKKMERVR